MNKNFLKEPICYAVTAAIALFCYVLIADSANVKTEISSAVDRCINIIIPSLFAFMAVSNILIESGLYYYLSKPFSLISKYLIGMPSSLFFVFLMGNVAGYPVGVKLLSDMVKEKKIEKRTAEIMSCVCCCGGPAFYAGTIGLGIFGSTKVGLGVFVSIVCANLITAVFLCRIFKLKDEESIPDINLDSQMLTNSVLNAGRSLFTICTMIIFFSAVMSVMNYFEIFTAVRHLFNDSDNITPIIRSLFEITSITQIENMSFGILPVITAVCSFGGFCVLMQIIAINKKSFSLKYFYLTRPIIGGLSALIFSLLKKYFIPTALETISNNARYLVDFNNFATTICLILMILLLKYKKRLVFSE